MGTARSWETGVVDGVLHCWSLAGVLSWLQLNCSGHCIHGAARLPWPNKPKYNAIFHCNGIQCCP